MSTNKAVQPVAETGKVLLFTLPALVEGESDREYFVPEKLPFNKVAKISRMVSTKSLTEEQLTWAILDLVVGPEAIDDLLEYEGLTPDFFNTVSERLQEIFESSTDQAKN